MALARSDMFWVMPREWYNKPASEAVMEYYRHEGYVDEKGNVTPEGRKHGVVQEEILGTETRSTTRNTSNTGRNSPKSGTNGLKMSAFHGRSSQISSTRKNGSPSNDSLPKILAGRMKKLVHVHGGHAQR